MGDSLERDNDFIVAQGRRQQNHNFAGRTSSNLRDSYVHQRDVEALIAFSRYPIACFEFTPAIDLKQTTSKIVDAILTVTLRLEANPMMARDMNQERTDLFGPRLW
ncbi:MAG: hypothetical protein R3A13_10695 [Bdellovibrionota bacterium]